MTQEKAVPVVELKACPFCGGDKVGTIYIRDGRRATCACGAAGEPCFHGPADKPTADERAIRAWNTRVPDEQQAATIAELREALKEARLIVDNLPHDESLFLAKIDTALAKVRP